MLTNETLGTIKQRRSIRSFRDEQIKDEEYKTFYSALIGYKKDMTVYIPKRNSDLITYIK